ncbi:MAG: NUDIX domain-containing protein [Candidatus Omnitrophica bacterium]|nr:NUDIX domain-containing protein [Candidatus Omnitrophota bacterium]MBD3269713.1 NUDIX domain-containing protein [Candidatus Omnitrophota bacterium]
MRRFLKVVAALIEAEGRFLLCQRKDGDEQAGLWEFPGGTVEGNETLFSAIEREIKEETALSVKAWQVVERFIDESPDYVIEVFLCRCDILGGKIWARDCKDFGFFTLKEAEKLDLVSVDLKILKYLSRRKSNT